MNDIRPFTERVASLRGLLERASDRFAEVLPQHLTPEKLTKAALIAVNKTPALLDCSPASFLQSMMTAAQLGLDPSGTLGSAYLIPYGKTCQLIVGYRGLIDLARRSGQISSIEAHPVFRADGFTLELGLEPRLIHRPDLEADDRGELIACYAIARLTDGTVQIEAMSRQQIDGIRQRSRASGSGPWVTDFDEMARKTVVRRLAKYLPLSPELETAFAQDDAAEAGAQEADWIEKPQPPTGPKASRLAAQLEQDEPIAEPEKPLETATGAAEKAGIADAAAEPADEDFYREPDHDDDTPF